MGYSDWVFLCVFEGLHYGDILITLGGLQWGGILMLILVRLQEKHSVQRGIWVSIQNLIEDSVANSQ